jgi:ribosome-associated protein
MSGESIQVTRSVSIPRSEIDLRFSRSSGPGGQHAQKRRVIAKAGPVLRAVAQDERSQWRNRELATARLVESLREALRVPRRRKPTKPSKAAVERRLEAKRRRAKVKRLRRKE